MAENKIYSPTELNTLFARLSDMETLSETEQFEVISIINKFATELDVFYQKHDKLNILSINFDV